MVRPQEVLSCDCRWTDNVGSGQLQWHALRRVRFNPKAPGFCGWAAQYFQPGKGVPGTDGPVLIVPVPRSKKMEIPKYAEKLSSPGSPWPLKVRQEYSEERAHEALWVEAGDSHTFRAFRALETGRTVVTPHGSGILCSLWEFTFLLEDWDNCTFIRQCALSHAKALKVFGCLLLWTVLVSCSVNLKDM